MQKYEELKQNRIEEAKNNADFREKILEWRDNPDALPLEDKEALLQKMHEQYAEVYDFDPAQVHIANLSDKFENGENSLGAVPRGESENIYLDKSVLENFGKAMDVLDHESAHIMQTHMALNADNYKPGDPQYEAAQRFQDSLHSDMAYDPPEGQQEYYLFSAHEMDAFSIDSPTGLKFSRQNYSQKAQDEAEANAQWRNDGQKPQAEGLDAGV